MREERGERREERREESGKREEIEEREDGSRGRKVGSQCLIPAE